MSISIEGKTAIVTGAASGVGLAIARHFVEQGAQVMFADSDEKALEHEFSSGESSNARFFAANLNQKLSRANLLSATIDAFERVDILVNANRRTLSSEPLDASKDGVEDLLNQNLMTSLRMSQIVAKRLIKQAEEEEGSSDPAGSIINLSSIAAARTQPELLAYSVASAAVDQMTRSMALALAPYRIRVNAIALGSVMSASLQRALKENDQIRGEVLEHTPLARIASAGELADVAQFLASEGSGFMTGQVLTMDGGRSLVDTVTTPVH